MSLKPIESTNLSAVASATPRGVVRLRLVADLAELGRVLLPRQLETERKQISIPLAKAWCVRPKLLPLDVPRCGI
jgi:hypothetical protein